MMRHIMPGCSAATLPCRKPLPGGDLGAGVEMPAKSWPFRCYRCSLARTILVKSVTSVTLKVRAQAR